MNYRKIATQYFYFTEKRYHFELSNMNNALHDDTIKYFLECFGCNKMIIYIGKPIENVI